MTLDFANNLTADRPPRDLSVYCKKKSAFKGILKGS